MAIGMANTAEGCNERKLRSNVGFILEMINLSTDRLEGLRTHCNSNVVLTKQEIRTLETKLVKMFSELLIAKSKLPGEQSRITQNAIELKLWLRVVGLSGESLNTVIHRVNSIEALMYENENELRAILNHNSSSDVRAEETRRLIRALRCLKDCQAGRKEQSDLFWDSWDRQTGTSPRIGHKITTKNQQHHSVVYQSRIQSEQNQSPVETSPSQHIEQIPNNSISPEEVSFHSLTPSPSPPNSPSISLNHKSKVKGFITTPPPRKKHQTLVSTGAIGTPPSNSNSNYHSSSLTCSTSLSNNNSPVNIGSYDQNSLTKSRSHEFQHNKQQQLQLETTHQQIGSNNIHQPIPMVNGMQQPTTMISGSNHNSTNITTPPNIPTPRTRLHTEPESDHTTDLGDNITSNNLIVPRSPCTPIITRGMGHMIQHRFTKKFKMTSSTCDLCNKQMFFGFKCTECKYRCHKDCKSNVPPSCGLPQEFVDEFKKKLNDGIMPNTSPNLGRNLMPNNRREKARIQNYNIQSYHGPDSSSAGSSCNSSSPSSPALLASCIPPQTPATTSNRSQFNFPEIASSNNISISAPAYISNGVPEIDIREDHEREKESATSIVKQNLSELSDTHHSNDSEKTVSLTGSTSTSTDSDRTPVRLDSMEERDSINWPRQNSLSLKEWDIPFDDLKFLEKVGEGNLGTVYKGHWHGDVAVKVLKENYLDDERTLEAFKLEVATFKKTRHENLVLFMGACMQPRRLAIITSLCKGNTLFTLIHLRKDKFNLNRTTLVAQQISQGMGYLHARGIVHKDLKTKNIFLENGKVIITDFGLFSATKLQYTDRGLGVARDWLCYLAPELMRGLKPYRPTDEDLLFSKGSDVYAFGTVWYELLCGEFPFKHQPHESVIWQVGRGMKQTLANLQAARDVKDILMLCWAYESEDRPDFSKLLSNLERLPKKRLARSPSHPIQLSRSAESVF